MHLEHTRSEYSVNVRLNLTYRPTIANAIVSPFLRLELTVILASALFLKNISTNNFLTGSQWRHSRISEHRKQTISKLLKRSAQHGLVLRPESVHHPISGTDAFSLSLCARRLVDEDRSPISCDDFADPLCLDLAFEHYGLTPAMLSSYGAMHLAMLADSIECHYIYDVCPFFVAPITGERRACVDGGVAFLDEDDSLNEYECRGVDLLSFLPIVALGSNNNASGADIWGYDTLDADGRVDAHYAITAQADGASVVDVTDPLRPNVLAFVVSNVAGELRNVLWRDVKVYRHWAIVVADTGGVDDHSVQIFDVDAVIAAARAHQAEANLTATELELIYRVPKDDVTIYDELGRCHNVYVDDNIGTHFRQF